jgi:hypothetical protein
MTKIKADPLTACKQYCLAAGATQGNIAYTQTVTSNPNRPTVRPSNDRKKASRTF